MNVLGNLGQGAWDSNMTKEQSATIFGLTAVLSSKQKPGLTTGKTGKQGNSNKSHEGVTDVTDATRLRV